ncbi:MAG: riboflavin synthase [Gammaproteobacteria bacterium]|nr:riboflavin synthase [Gammaproteobacteria bacterium]
MFTGIIENICKITAITQGASNSYKIHIDFSEISKNLEIGDSISVNGTCLTIEKIVDSNFIFTLSTETLNKTAFSKYKQNDFVNIETPLTLNKFISGHIVTGHVDCIAKIIDIEKSNDSWQILFQIDRSFAKYIIEKGSICIDGISLTINTVKDNTFSVMIIPHTLSNTIIQYYKNNIEVNVEVDMLLKHLEKLKND